MSGEPPGRQERQDGPLGEEVVGADLSVRPEAGLPAGVAGKKTGPSVVARSQGFAEAVPTVKTLRLLWMGLAVAVCWLAGSAGPARAAEDYRAEQNVILHVVAREALFFSAQSGTWTSVRLEAGERVIHRGTGENVAIVVTDLRAVAFSGFLSVAAEIRIRAGSEDAVETVVAVGNAASVLTRRHVYGFSAITGRWAVTERFQPR